MDWITAKVAIGNYIDARDSGLLKRESIRSLISLDGTVGSTDAAAFGLAEVTCHRLVDGDGNDPRIFASALANLQRMAESCAPVLVQCHAGRSRSAVLVAAYLMHDQNLTPKQALAMVAAKREISVASGLVKLLQQQFFSTSAGTSKPV